MKKAIIITLISLSVISSMIYLIFNIQNSVNLVNGLGPIISSGIIALFSLVFGIVSLAMLKDKGQLAVALTSIFITAFTTFSLLNALNIINLPEAETIDDFTNVGITEAMDWASSNDIEIIQSYEYSDTVPIYHIIDQNVIVGTLTKEIETIEFVISLGPNYDKQVVVPNMLGWEIDESLSFINDNYLNNVNIKYEINDMEKDIIIAQDESGTLRRSDEINLTVSLGSEDELMPVPLPNMVDKTLFESTLWLKRNGIKYKLEYVFSDIVERHTVINQSLEEGTEVTPFETTVTLTVSKGTEIVVPNLYEMTIEEITNWVVENGLQINFSDDYDDAVEIGKLITSNRKEGDKLQQGDSVNIVTSKGPLKMQAFASLSDFRNWAAEYDIPYEEEYDFNDNIASGGIVSFSSNEGDIIGNNETIHVIVSQGAPVTIPNFYNMSWSSIQTKCNQIGLKCYYKTGNYSSSIKKDYAYAQSKSSGSTVVEGTSITVTLSKGTASSWLVELPEACYTTGSYSGAVSCLKTNLAKYTDVTFKYVAKASADKTSGMPHDDSPLKPYDYIKQGNTYYIWIVE